MSTEKEDEVVTMYESNSIELTTQESQANNWSQTVSGAQKNNQSQLIETPKAEHSETASQNVGSDCITGQQAAAAVNTSMSKDYIRLSSQREPEKTFHNNASNPSMHSSITHCTPQLQIQQPESTMQFTNRQQSRDTETDAKPSTPMPGDRPYPEVKQWSSLGKSDKMRQLEHDILRPTDHNDQRMTKDHLVDIVIVFAKPDYELASAYQQWLEEIAKCKRIYDIKIELYTSEKFPANDVKVVEDVVNRAMRVLMLLSSNFEKEVSLTFIKEEAIGLTRLQEMPKEEMISLFATSILSRKKNCVRPVHTQKQKYYKTPVGLSALRAFNFFEPNKNSAYEKDTTGNFLKSAREDRMYHSKEIIRHQATNNPEITQAEEELLGEFYGKQYDIDKNDYQQNTDKITTSTVQNLQDNKAVETTIAESIPQHVTPEVKLQHQQTNISVATSGHASIEHSENQPSILQSRGLGNTVPQSLFPERDIEKDASAAPDDSEEVKEHRLSYTGPSGRSGIQTGANPEFQEYMTGVPAANGQQSGNSLRNSMNTTNSRSSMPNQLNHSVDPQSVDPQANVGPLNPQSVHYHYHYNTPRPDDDLELDQGPVSQQPNPRTRRTQSPSIHEPSSPPVRTGPVFNIQGCATVQIGDGNKVIGNQTVEATNNIGSVSGNTTDNDRERDVNNLQRPAGEDQSTIVETAQTYTSGQQDSLNDLDPVSDPEKLKKLDSNISSDDNGEDEHSYGGSQDKTMDSEHMFGNGNDSLENLSSSFSDKTSPEKVLDEMLNEKTCWSETETCEKDFNEKQATIDIECLDISANIPSSLSSESIELSSLSTKLRLESRKNGHILGYYNTNVQCSISCCNTEDEID